MRCVNKTSRIIFFIFFVDLTTCPAFADNPSQNPDILDGEPYGKATAQEQSESKAPDSNDSEFAGIPALFSTPETGFGGGGAIIYLGPKLKTRRNFMLAGATFTERKQFLTAGVIELFDAEEHYSIQCEFKLTKYPDYFFGVGNKTRIEDRDLYTMKSREIGLAAKVSPGSASKHQFGLGLRQEITDFAKFTDSGILSKGAYVGNYGGLHRYVTGSWQYQNNDEEFDPHWGTRLTWDIYKSTKALGSDFENVQLWSNNAHFIPLSGKSTLALNLYGEFSDGQIPWYHLAQAGGTNILRGYFMGRYRDKQMLLTQVEWRRHLFNRIGAVAFAGIGQVADTVRDLSDGAPLASWGAGLRYRLSRKQRINARLDVGFNRSEPRTPAPYLYILEAF